MQLQEAEKYCGNCGAQLAASAKYCSQCGTKLGRTQAEYQAPLRSTSFIFTVIGVSILVCVIGWNWSSSIGGPKPGMSHSEWVAKMNPELQDPALDRLREAVKAAPDDSGAWKALGHNIFSKITAMEQPPNQLVFEFIDVLREILAREPNDRFALLAMADVSLNQQIFPKAVEYFERYLAVFGDDDQVRARYASALAFVGRSDEAVQELQGILQRDPGNFQAKAYLAVTFAQAGDREQALKRAEEALALAPNEDARARIGVFVESLKDGSLSMPPPRDSQATAKSTGQSQDENTAENISKINAMSAFIKANNVSGPKFIDAQVNGNLLRLKFQDFPMDKMPPFIRERFVASVKVKAKEIFGEVLGKIEFIDSRNDTVLLSESL